MLEEFVNIAVKKIIEQKYPHLLTPSVLNAKITKVSETGEINEKKIDFKETPWGTGECIINQKCFEYSLKIITEDGENDETYPAVPKVKSYEEYKAGDIVSVVMAYGKANVQIVGKVG